MKHIGIVGVSPPGAALCYTHICAKAAEIIGQYKNPEISLHNYPFDKILSAQNAGKMDEVAKILVSSIKKLAASGAEFAIIPANSVHFVIDEVRKKSPIPVLSIVDAVVEECVKKGYKKAAVLGVGMTMSKGLYEGALKKKEIKHVVPLPKDQEIINAIIYNELVNGRVEKNSVEKITGIIGCLKSDGCDVVILACTELPLAINNSNSPLPIIDSTRLLAEKAVEYSFEK